MLDRNDQLFSPAGDRNITRKPLVSMFVHVSVMREDDAATAIRSLGGNKNRGSDEIGASEMADRPSI